ncbi:sugar nucleotide-binding protein [Schleiferiaceae bacterium]|nr:sugar nucleotide-binding protein [Schleiferiaceae bacterium]
MRNRIIILGPKGMLGQMVSLYFSRCGFDVIEFQRRFTDESFLAYIQELNNLGDGIVVNCIGRIKQKSEDAHELVWSNSILPLALARSLKSSHVLIQPSTDCVFDGQTKYSYNSRDMHTAKDLYGWSKSLGETAILARPNSLVIRVSIIGPDKNSNKGLLAWFLGNSSRAKLNGYTNHYWNGITTLEWCKILHDLIANENLFIKYFDLGLVQIGTEQVFSKFDMLSLFADIFDKDLQINATASDYTYRCLKPDILAKPLRLQLTELKQFYFSEK